MAKKESSKSKAELYREERKERIAKAAKQNSTSVAKRNNIIGIAKKVVAIVICAAIVLGIGWKLVDNLGVTERLTTAVKVGDEKLSTAQFNYYYSMIYQKTAYMANYYTQNYGTNLTGYDTTKAPDEQTTKDDDGNEITWNQYFINTAKEQVQSDIAYYSEAVKAGYTLTDDEKDQIDETIESFRTNAADNNYSLNAFLRENFGGGFTEKVFRKQIEIGILADRFMTEKQEELKSGFTDEEIKAEYEANINDYNLVNVSYYEFKFTTLTAEEGETEDSLKARQEEKNAQVIAEANEALEKITGKDNFAEAVGAKDDEDTYYPFVKYSTLSAAVTESGADWAFAAKESGAKTVIEGEKAAYVILVETPSFATNSVDVRHCLVKFIAEDEDNVTSEEKEATWEVANELYQEWLSGDADEDSFIELVKENTEDTASQETGGLYDGMRATDSYVASFKEWSFDSARKKGDSGIIETEYGYHIMYFVSDNTEDTDWNEAIRSTKGSEAFEEYETELLSQDGSYAIVENERWTAYTGKSYCKTIKKSIATSN